MLNYSFSTVLMTVLTSTILICIIAACFHSKKVLLSIGYKLLGVCLILTLIRFIFPFEVPFTRNIPLSESLSMIVSHIRHPFFTLGRIKVSVWFLLECIWICGSIVMAVKIIRRNLAFRRYIFRYGIDVTGQEPYAFAFRKVCGSEKINLRIILVPGLDTPQQYGFLRAAILIPSELKLTDQELYYTIYHEFSHYRHHDYLVKLGMNILLAVYWWNPLCHTLSRQVDTLLELHVDEKLVNSDPRIRAEYLDTLLHIGSNLACIQDKPHRPAYLSSPKAVADIRDLSTRVHVLYGDGKISKPLFAVLLGMVVALFLFSYCFIFEAHYRPDSHTLETLDMETDEMYAIMLEDGSYNMYYGNIFLENVDSLEYYESVTVID